MLEIAAAREEAEWVGAHRRLLRERRGPESSDDGRRFEDVREVLPCHVAADERGLVREGRRRIDLSVGIDTDRVPTRVSEVVLDTRHAVHSPFGRLQVVERRPLACRGVHDGENGFEKRDILREEAVSALDRAAALVAPHEVLALRADALDESGDLREFGEVLLGRDRRQRDVEAHVREKLRAVERLDEGAGSANRVVRFGAGPVDRHLELHFRAVQRLEAFFHGARKDGRVREDDHLGAVGFGRALREIEDVPSEERLAARDVKALHSELLRAVDEPHEGRGVDARRAAGARRDEAVRAREVARVVDLQPELAEPSRFDERRAAGVGLAGERRVRQHAGAVEGTEEVVDMEPGFPRLELMVGGPPRDERAERNRRPRLLRRPNRAKQLSAARVDSDPVRRLVVDGVENVVFHERVERGDVERSPLREDGHGQPPGISRVVPGRREERQAAGGAGGARAGATGRDPCFRARRTRVGKTGTGRSEQRSAASAGSRPGSDASTTRSDGRSTSSKHVQKSRSGRVTDETRKNTRRPPRHFFEEFRKVRPRTRPDQPDAAVRRWAENDVPRFEGPEGGGELRLGQAGHVSGNGDDFGVARGARVLERVLQALAESAAVLRQNARLFRRGPVAREDQVDPAEGSRGFGHAPHREREKAAAARHALGDPFPERGPRKQQDAPGRTHVSALGCYYGRPAFPGSRGRAAAPRVCPGRIVKPFWAVCVFFQETSPRGRKR